MQEIVEAQRLKIVKIAGVDNISDIGTKALDFERHNYLMKQMGMQKMNDETKVNMIANLRHGGGAEHSVQAKYSAQCCGGVSAGTRGECSERRERQRAQPHER